jgi:hypothetical protein
VSFVRFTSFDGEPVFVNREHIIAIETVNLVTTIFLTSSGSTGRNLAFLVREERSLALLLAKGSWLARLQRRISEWDSNRTATLRGRA